MRKRDAGEGGEDTVEKAVEGLAESILKEDEEKRKEELVLKCSADACNSLCTRADHPPGLVQHPAQAGELGSQEGHDKSDGQAGPQNQ